MKSIDPNQIVAVVHVEIGHYVDDKESIDKEMQEMNQMIKDHQYTIWGKPVKMWDQSEQKHYFVYTLVLLEKVTFESEKKKLEGKNHVF